MNRSSFISWEIEVIINNTIKNKSNQIETRLINIDESRFENTNTMVWTENPKSVPNSKLL
jgi:hypothetical protein